MDRQPDQELHAAYTERFLVRFRLALCPRRLLSEPTLPFSHLGAVSATKQQQVFERDGGMCYLCGLTVIFSEEAVPRQQSIDHVIPRSRGGSSALDNLRLAHRQCNQRKGAQPHYRTVFARDEWHCRRCHQMINPDEQTWDFWTRPIVEHAYPLDAGEMWLRVYAWTVHQRCRLMWTLDGTYAEA